MVDLTLPRLLGTLKSTFRVNKLTLSAANLTVARAVIVPDKDGTIAMLDDTKRVVQIALNDGTALTTAALAYFRTPAIMNGWVLTAVAAMCKTASTSGIPTFTIKNGATSMLTTNLTIDANETDSSTAATAAVIDTASSHNIVNTGNQIEIACSVAGTGTAWTVVELTFSAP